MELKPINEARVTACGKAGTHKFFVATTVGVEAVNHGGGGKVSILLCCTACGMPLMHTFLVPGNVREPGHIVEKPKKEVKQ